MVIDVLVISGVICDGAHVIGLDVDVWKHALNQFHFVREKLHVIGRSLISLLIATTAAEVGE